MNILATQPDIKAMTDDAIDRVRSAEQRAMLVPQEEIEISHSIYSGLYHRTCRVPANVMITGALIKIPTTVIVSGDCAVYIGDSFKRITGYQVLAAAPNRKQIFIALAETFITMLFPTDADNVKHAEEQFTDEWHLLTTRHNGG